MEVPMSKWKEIETKPGVAEKIAILNETPRGPYFLIPQHEEQSFLKNFYSMSHVSIPTLEVKFGHATYAIDMITGMPIKVAYYYDTSD